jgi:hypothetical protein
MPIDANVLNQKIRMSPSKKIRKKKRMRNGFFVHITSNNFVDVEELLMQPAKQNRSVKGQNNKSVPFLS